MINRAIKIINRSTAVPKTVVRSQLYMTDVHYMMDALLPFSALTLLVGLGRQEGHPACKNFAPKPLSHHGTATPY